MLQLLRRIKDDGVTVLFVSHKLEEVLAVADQVSVLRDGSLIGTRPIAGLTKPRDRADDDRPRRAHRSTSARSTVDCGAARCLRRSDISQAGRFEDVSFALHQGEILGFYGLVGSGRTELAQILIGEERKDGGEILIDGAPATSTAWRTASTSIAWAMSRRIARRRG